MTLYLSFHLATTNKGLSVCAHPASLFKCAAAEIYGPFENDKQAGEFVNAIMECQAQLFDKIGKAHVPESAVQQMR